MKRIVLGVALSGLLASFASAALTPEQRAAADAFIRQFAAAEFGTRQKAVDGLVALGPDAAPLVKKALAATNDNEAKLRCEMVLKALRAKFGAEAVDGAAPAAAVNLGASRLTLEFKDTPLDEALETLAAASGNRPLKMPGGRGGLAGLFQGKDVVTLAAKDMPYWQALDAVCRQAGLVYEGNWDPKDPLRLRRTDNRGDEMSVVTGPVVVRLDRIERSDTSWRFRRFRTDPTDENLKAQKQANLTFALRYFVEDRLSAIGSWMRVTKAAGPDGVNRLPAHMLREDADGGRRRHMGAGGVFAGDTSVSIQETEAAIAGPVTIEGKVMLELALGRREVKVGGIPLRGFAKEQSVEAEGVEIRVTRVDLEGNRATIALSLRAESGTVVCTGGRDAAFGFALVDPAGKRFADIQQFVWKSENMQASGGGGAGVRLDEYVKPGQELEGKLSLTFSNLPAADGDWSLVFLFPERREVKEYPFALKDVPLP